MISTRSFCQMPTHEYVVPRSMPTAGPEAASLPISLGCSCVGRRRPGLCEQLRAEESPRFRSIHVIATARGEKLSHPLNPQLALPTDLDKLTEWRRSIDCLASAPREHTHEAAHVVAYHGGARTSGWLLLLPKLSAGRKPRAPGPERRALVDDACLRHELWRRLHGTASAAAWSRGESLAGPAAAP